MKWQRSKQYKRLVRHCTFLISVFFIFVAVPTTSAYISHSFDSTQHFDVGSVVGISESGELEEVSLIKGEYSGVVVNTQGAQVDVAQSGTAKVKFTSVDKAAQAGQKIGLSNILGVSGPWKRGGLIGTIKSVDGDWQEVKASSGSGSEQSVYITLVTASLMDGSQVSSGTASYIDQLQSAASRIAGSPVGIWRAVISFFVGLAGLVLSLGLLLTISKQSFVSIGRNPLAKSVIIHNLWKMSFVSLGVLLASLTVSYMILKVG